jgi:hypothetical protein
LEDMKKSVSTKLIAPKQPEKVELCLLLQWALMEWQPNFSTTSRSQQNTINIPWPLPLKIEAESKQLIIPSEKLTSGLLFAQITQDHSKSCGMHWVQRNRPSTKTKFQTE